MLDVEGVGHICLLEHVVYLCMKSDGQGKAGHVWPYCVHAGSGYTCMCAPMYLYRTQGMFANARVLMYDSLWRVTNLACC